MISKSIFIVGAVLIVLGLIMIPLPGPGLLVISLGVPVLLAGVVVSAVSGTRRSGRGPSVSGMTVRPGTAIDVDPEFL